MQRITNRAPQKEIAAATGIDQTSISRWKNGQSAPGADAAVKVARAYRQAPVEALIAAGYLHTDEVGGVVEVEPSIHDLSTEELLNLQTDLHTEFERRYKILRGTPEVGRRKADGHPPPKKLPPQDLPPL